MSDTLHVWPPLPSVAELAEKEIQKVDATTDIKLGRGFKHTVNGEELFFHSELTDQINMVNGVVGALLSLQLGNMSAAKRTEIFGNELVQALPADWKIQWRGYKANGEAITLSLGIADFLKLANAMSSNIVALLAAGWTVKAQLAGAADEAALKAVAADLKIDENLRDAKAGK